MRQPRTIYIAAQPRLDPITLYIDNIEPGKGRITVLCFDTAWTAYWGGMGSETVEQFLLGVNYDYLADNLIRSAHMKQSKGDLMYIQRISVAILAALKELA